RHEAKEMLVSMGAIAIPRLIVYASILKPGTLRSEVLAILSEAKALTPQFMRIAYHNSRDEGYRSRLVALAGDLNKLGLASEPEAPIPKQHAASSHSAADSNFWEEYRATYQPYLRYGMLMDAAQEAGFLDAAAKVLAVPGYPYREEVVSVFGGVLMEANKKTIMRFSGHPSEGVRAAVAAMLPYLPSSVRDRLLERFLKDPSPFVRKESLYGILRSIDWEGRDDRIARATRLLQDQDWVCRYMAKTSILSFGRVDGDTLQHIILSDDWKLKANATPLIQLLGLSEAFPLWRAMLAETRSSIFYEAMQGMRAYLSARPWSEIAPYIVKLLADHDPWVVSRVLKMVGELELEEKEFIKVRAVLKDIAVTSKNGFARVSAYGALGSLMRINRFSPSEYAATRVFLRESLGHERVQVVRWSIIDALGIPEPPDDAGVNFQFRDEFAGSFADRINYFNDRLAIFGHTGRIERIVFEDSSYSKPNSRFLIGSDIDVFRIIYTGEIPEAVRMEFRNAVWDLGVFIKPDEPEWVRQEEESNMFRTAVDVVVYERPYANIKREIINDFMEEKPLKRERCFRMLEEGILNSAEEAVFRKIHRAIALATLYDLDTRLYLADEKEKEALLTLCHKNFVGVYVNGIQEVSIRAECVTYAGRDLPVYLPGGRLEYGDFRNISDRVGKQRSARHYVSYPRPTVMTEKEEERLVRAARINDSVYREICAGTREGFD
ncbi:MAG TPA: hypothetical protein PLV52_04905, partial [Candidatus Omnitrophota bacterium]|nr:hypothetical protein [Candidatus Omnitrophota bacterium]